MPVVINEIQITAYVNEPGNAEQREQLSRTHEERKNSEIKKEALVKICVEEVLRILQEKKER
ncbi:MAG TPA: DUF5908 family protein [Lacibacter sp.]|nr:DUF5908 family protein [Lacibacter sp.]